ncbi:ribosomal RNA small subunit methyltransferase F [Peptococcaceae bacterium CEB3]|nr:ribosomal RNA small subunit methyltransferase F [Peptococcaceae bacterium CEB3]
MSTFILPQPFQERMSALLGTEYPAFAASYEAPRTNGLRVNTLKINPGSFQERGLFALEPIPWAKDGFYYDYREQPGRHPYHGAGVYYLQEPSAMAAVSYLDPRPGERILDLAAAPGGKSTQIACLLQQRGLLWANEIDSSRARILALNLDRWGACNVIVSNESPRRLAEHLPEYFDRVLLDAPCSGEGMFRKNPSAVREWSPENVRACAQRQGLILESAACLLKPGGRLVYSTCTFSPAENEETILSFLAKHPEFSPLELPDPTPDFVHSPGLPGAVRLYPHRLRGEGHFIAALQKKPSPKNPRDELCAEKPDRGRGGDSATPYPDSSASALLRPRFSRTGSTDLSRTATRAKSRTRPAPSVRADSRAHEVDLASFLPFAQTTLSDPLSRTFTTQPASPHTSEFAFSSELPTSSELPASSEFPASSKFPASSVSPSSSEFPFFRRGSFLFFGSHLYLNPAPDIPLDRLRLLRPGLHLGEMKPGRFLPGQAFAQALRPRDVSSYLSFTPGDSRLESYLRGESWTEPGPDGWVLIGVDEFPLGWAKRVAGQIKNHYPKELRTKH